MAGKLALAKNVKHAVLDAGISTPSSKGRVYAALKGAVDAGVKVPLSEAIFPSEERISGIHISNYMNSSKSANQFSSYKKAGLSAEKVKGQVNSVKVKITGAKNG